MSPKMMPYSVAILFVVLALAQAAPDCSAITCPTTGSAVCGSDGKTYPNECQAFCAGVTLVLKKACPKIVARDCSAVKCMAGGSGVCGKDGQTYPNACLAHCAGADPATPGKCKPVVPTCNSLSCPSSGTAVCATNGKTYKSACAAWCKGAVVKSEGPCEGCICPAVYSPVCGINGKTYGNSCSADCSGVKIAYVGACKAACRSCIGKAFEPVCGTNGKSYGNKCYAVNCFKTKVDYMGKCNDGCICTREYKPVCGVDGKTYSNKCEAKCKNAVVAFPGTCSGCWKKCSQKNEKVCGSDNKTYLNKCVASKCAGVRVKYESKCGDIPGIICAPGSATARCTDTCATSTSPCKGQASLECIQNSCSKPLPFLGTKIDKVDMCGVVYVNVTSGTVVKACLPK